VLKTLSIKNYALIDSLTIDFNSELATKGSQRKNKDQNNDTGNVMTLKNG